MAQSPPGVSHPANVLWWQRGIVYQIYPLSFQDSNGDGKGDLDGIRQRLDYLVWLGVDAVWISPIYPSPMKDFGYDISDYCSIAQTFGTLDDFDRLLAEVHTRGLKLILDFVPNHTSDQHPWFLESRSSRDNPKRDWYLWRDPAPGGGPPSNWLSQFGGGAWEYDKPTGQYYYHAFLKEQPDLNWRNMLVREAMYDTLRFWLDRGVDGFRMDVLWHLIKDDQCRDNPPNPGFGPGDSEHRRLLELYTTDRPEVHEVVAEMRELFERYSERLIIGEIYLPVERLVAYYGLERPGVHLPFNFQLIHAPWNACEIDRMVREYDERVPEEEWPNWVLGNHDQHRIATRIGEQQARIAAMMLLALRGTPTLYYGDEIGMRDVAIAPERIQDPYEKKQPGLGLGRDPQRTPMQWDNSIHAGFSTSEPWLPLAEDFHRRNVKAQAQDAHSILTLYKRLIELRRRHKALSIGQYAQIMCEGQVLAFERFDATERLLVALNLGHEKVALPLALSAGTILLSTHLDRAGETLSGHCELRPDEGLIVDLS
ncbi:MAG: alpha amylase catalytic region [Betaproteobacteria bacterium]|nr:alpha amylase catalytic region [Betaproteobacteria bacterium]